MIYKIKMRFAPIFDVRPAKAFDDGKSRAGAEKRASEAAHAMRSMHAQADAREDAPRSDPT